MCLRSPMRRAFRYIEKKSFLFMNDATDSTKPLWWSKFTSTLQVVSLARISMHIIVFDVVYSPFLRKMSHFLRKTSRFLPKISHSQKSFHLFQMKLKIHAFVFLNRRRWRGYRWRRRGRDGRWRSCRWWLWWWRHRWKRTRRRRNLE